MPTQDVATVSAQTPTLNINKVGFVIGNDVQWIRTIMGLLGGDTPINAWLTIKSSPAAQDGSGVQCPITVISSGFGIIVINIVSGNPIGTCTFNMGAEQTLVLSSGPLYYYDIKVQCTPSRSTYTVEQGWIQFLPEVGDAPIPNNGSINLPPAVPVVLFGTNPPPNGVFQVGTRYWVVPPSAGFPSEWVFADDNSWHVTSVVSQ